MPLLRIVEDKIDTYPVNRIPYAYPSPCKPRVGVSPRLRMIPLRLPPRTNIVKFGQPADLWSPSKIVHDEPLDACGFRRIDHGDLRVNARRPDNAHGGILPQQSLD